MSRRRWQILGAAVLLIGVAGSVLALTLTGSRRSAAAHPHLVSSAQARALAARACTGLDAAHDLITADGRADRVRELIATAVRDSSQAAYSDPRWVLLASNAQLLQLAIDKDSGPAAAQAMIAVGAQCARASAAATPSPTTP